MFDTSTLGDSCFNPRSLKGNDYCKGCGVNVYAVSIHVPSRGTTIPIVGLALSLWFQSTFPQGERRCSWLKRSCAIIVSIHVPSRGTTTRIQEAERTHTGFNPRSHKGNDGYCGRYCSCRIRFNPRSHKGNDELPRVGEVFKCWFQSTFPQGERPTSALTNFRDLKVSIHVPTRGTTKWLKDLISSKQFQSTFPQGERQHSDIA